ncbi:hypothetical protein DSECCO2_552940 [anaerobic digester metagenome]
MAPDDEVRQAQLARHLAHFVLEQFAQRLDELQVHLFRQAAHVVVALDDGGRALVRHRLDDVGVQGALRQEVHVPEGLGFLVEHLDEGVADDLALLLGVFHAFQLVEEAALGLHVLQVQVEVFAQVVHHFLTFVQAQHAVVHEDAVQALADGLVQQHGHHGGIDAARKGAYHVAVTHGFGHFLHRALHERRHGPVGLQLGHMEQEVVDDAGAFLGVVHFGVELHGVDAAGVVGHGRHVQGGGAAHHGKAGRGRLDLVAVAHPHAGGG